MSLFLIGLLPIILFLVMLAVLKFSPMISAYSSLAVAVVLSFLVPSWRMPVGGIVGSILEGFAVAWMPIGFVVIAAIFAYDLSVKTGKIETVKKMLGNITTDQRALALILAWGFGGFIEGVAGYGTAVAIPLAIMVSLGFNPLNAAVICLIANTTPTAFGTVGLPVTTMASILGLSANEIALDVSLLLFPIMIFIPFILVFMANKERKGNASALGGGIIPVLIASILGYAVQPFIAMATGAELPTILSSLLAMILMIVATKIFIKNEDGFEAQHVSVKDGILAWLPYILMVILIIGTSPMVHAVHEALEHTNSVFNFTFGNANMFNDIKGDISKANVTFKWLLAPGAPILIATVIAGYFQGAKTKEMVYTLKHTIVHKIPSLVVIMGIVALSVVMKHSGMINSIAQGFQMLMGDKFALISPFLGTIGTFVTGSDLSSNLLFGNLQTNVAEGLRAGHEPLKALFIAANTGGATGGKMISPQNIAIAASTVGLMGQEGTMLGKTLKFSLMYALILGILVFVGSGLV